MTVPVQTGQNDYTANGVTTVFPYTFRIISQSDLKVYINDILVTIGYTVSGVGNNFGGNVTFSSAPVSGTAISLQRMLPVDQQLDLGEYTKFPAEAVERQFDRLAMIDEQQDRAQSQLRLEFDGFESYVESKFDAVDIKIDEIDSSISHVQQAIESIQPDSELSLSLAYGSASVGGAKSADLAKATLNVPNLKSLAAIPFGQRRAGITYRVMEFNTGTGIGGHDLKWNPSKTWTSSDIGLVWPDVALNAWDGTAAGLSVLYGDFGAGTGCWQHAEIIQNFESLGALAANDSIIPFNVGVSKGIAKSVNSEARATFNISESIKYVSERVFKGSGYSFGGTVIAPTGNFPVLAPLSPTTAYTRINICDLLFRCEAHTDAVALPINQLFLAEFDKLWFKDAYIGVTITESDSVTFRDVKFMETQRNKAVVVGNGSRSIRFITCNFETSIALKDVGGVVEIDGPLGYLPYAEFYGSQWERSGLIVKSGKAFVSGGKFADCNITLLKGSKDTDISTSFYGNCFVRDYGFNNTLQNPNCNNMNTIKHEWPTMQGMDAQATNSVSVALPNTEWLALVSITNKTTNNLTNAGIESNSVVPIASVTGVYLHRQLLNLGSSGAQSYTELFYGSNGATKSTITATGSAHIAGVKGGINLLSNGRFSDGSTGWSTQACSIAPAAGAAVVTPSASSWGVFRDLSAICKPGKRYIAVAKYSGTASLVLGQSWDGSSGARYLIDSGIELGSNGYKTAMLSFTYFRSLGRQLSLGGLTNAGPVTIEYIALIGVDEDYVPPSTSQPYYQASSIQEAGTGGTLAVSETFRSGAIPVAQAELGDLVVASFNKDLQGVSLTGYVRESGLVIANFFNGTAVPVSLGTGTITVRVYKRQ